MSPGKRPAQAVTKSPKVERQRTSRAGTPIAPVVSVVGLIAVAVVSVWVMSVFGAASAAGPGPTQRPGESGPIITAPPRVTPNPTIVITPPPEQRPTITGTILFSRTGNIWAASGLDLTSVATAGTDSSPAWSPDGSTIYAIQTTDKPNQDPPFDAAKYFLRVTNIVSMNADGSNRKQVFKGQFSQNGGTWFTGVYQPDVSPDGNRFALVSDLGYVPVNGCESCYQPIVLSTMSTDGTKLTNLKVRYDNDLGHNDPDWSPDGKEIAFTYNSRGGTDGAPRIGILTVSTGSLNLLRKGYANPSWSRDGTMIAAERTTSSGRDIVVLDPRSGSELARLTNDGDSFRPEFSPNGDQIAFLHRKGLGVDLQIMTISQSGGGITLLETKPVTDDGSLDATSSPAWFIPADQITSPPAGPAASAAP